MKEKKRRPGRKIEAEKRRIARETIEDFAQTEGFRELDRKVQIAIIQLNPRMRRMGL